MTDLLVLVADSYAEAAIRCVLERRESLRIRAVTFDVYRHPEHDAGVFRKAHEFLRPFRASHSHALVVFDREGCGTDANRQDIADIVRERIEAEGWAGRSRVIVIEPELEAWLWSDSPHVAQALGWKQQRLRQWLGAEWQIGQEGKPNRPKEAVEEALRQSKTPKSAAIYRRIARTVSLTRCNDSAFEELKRQLVEWFPAETSETD